MYNLCVHPQDAVDLLNEMYALDGAATAALIENRVPCNEALLEHPTIQVGATNRYGHGLVGLLGVLNGLFGVHNTRGCIIAMYDEHTGELLGFTTDRKAMRDGLTQPAE